MFSTFVKPTATFTEQLWLQPKHLFSIWQEALMKTNFGKSGPPHPCYRYRQIN
jgi:hypothetical protein